MGHSSSQANQGQWKSIGKSISILGKRDIVSTVVIDSKGRVNESQVSIMRESYFQKEPKNK